MNPDPEDISPEPEKPSKIPTKKSKEAPRLRPSSPELPLPDEGFPTLKPETPARLEPEKVDSRPKERSQVLEDLLLRESGEAPVPETHDEEWQQLGEGAQQIAPTKARYLVTAAVFLLFIVGAAGWVIQKALNEGAGDEDDAAPIVTAPGPLPEPTQAFSDREVAQLLEGYFGATSTEQLKPHCRPVPNLDEILRAIPERHPAILNPQKVLTHQLRGVQTIGGESVWTCTVLLGGGNKTPIAIFETPQGPKIDLESNIVWQEVPWGEFLSKSESEESYTMRVGLSPEGSYLSPFSEESHYAVLLYAPRLKKPLYGFVPREGQVAKDFSVLAGIWNQGQITSPRVTVRLRPAGKNSVANLVEVTELIAPSWIVSTKRLEATRKRD